MADFEKIDATTDEEIRKQIAADPDLAPETDLSNATLVVPSTDVRKLRKRLKLSQRDFARTYGLSPRTVQGWEAGRKPNLQSRLILALIGMNPYGTAMLINRLRSTEKSRTRAA